MKKILLSILSFLSFMAVYAQGTVTYYLKNSGKRVMTIDSADYWMIVKPPDTAGKYPYNVYEYGKDGKMRLKTNANTNDLNLKYQGRYTAYFPNGKTKAAGMYEGGDMKGRQMQYYPNGNLYCIITYNSPGVGYFGECRDSTGAVLTTGGNGTWKQFNDDFTEVIAEGKMMNGLQEGEWRFKKSAAEYILLTFKAGQEIATAKSDPTEEFKPIEVVPTYPGGVEALYQFLQKHIVYPVAAEKNNTYGKVLVSFVVERDGELTDVKVRRGIGDGCDEEAVRVIKLTSPWKPGTQDGKPVRVAYSIPINFGAEK